MFGKLASRTQKSSLPRGGIICTDTVSSNQGAILPLLAFALLFLKQSGIYGVLLGSRNISASAQSWTVIMKDTLKTELFACFSTLKL